MGKIDEVLKPAFDEIKTESPGQFLLERFKEELLKSAFFRKLFGEKGEQIWVNEEKALNDSTMPVLRLRYQNDTYTNSDTVTSGAIDGVVIFPAILKGKTDIFRRLGITIQRWLGTNHKMFDAVPGLTMFGRGSTYRYDGLAVYSGTQYPAMPFTLPFEIDNHLFSEMCPEVDLDAPIDSDPLGFIRSYMLEIKSEETGKILTQSQVITGTGK